MEVSKAKAGITFRKMIIWSAVAEPPLLSITVV